MGGRAPGGSGKGGTTPGIGMPGGSGCMAPGAGPPTPRTGPARPTGAATAPGMPAGARPRPAARPAPSRVQESHPLSGREAFEARVARRPSLRFRVTG